MSTRGGDARKRLLVIASTFPGEEGDGTPPFVRDLARFEAQHFDTLVLVPRVPGATRYEAGENLRIERFPYFFRRWERLAHGAILENIRTNRWLLLQVPTFLVSEMIALRRAIRRFRPDVVHVHWMIPQGLVALFAARRVPWVLTTLGGDVYALRGPFWRQLKRRVVKRAYAVTTMSMDMRERVIELGGDPDRTVVLPMGANLSVVRSSGTGVSRVPGRVLVAGRLVEKKGISVLLEAMRRIPPEIDWSLDVVGDGPLRGELEASARGLARQVRFLGQQTREQLAVSMHEAEVVVLPSVRAASGDQDGLPVTLIEAMGAGCAIVASDIAGIDEAVEDRVSGLLVPPGDPDAIAGAIGELLIDPKRRTTLGEAAQRRAEQFSMDSIGERFVSLLREATSTRPAR